MTLVFTLIGGYCLLRPDIEVEPDIAIDPRQAIINPFKVTNIGQLPIYDVRCQCFLRGLVSEGSGTSMIGPATFDDLRHIIPKMIHGESTSVPVPIFFQPKTPFTKGDIDVVVVYSTAIIPLHQERHFRFEIRQGANDEFMWFHKAISE